MAAACWRRRSPCLVGCGQFSPPYLKPLSAQTQALLAEKGMSEQSPMLVRIFKSESELEIWKAAGDGHYYHFKTYPICDWSGKLGPKVNEGDRQTPEGFYLVSATQINPKSKYYLAFNVGFPNAYDRAYGRTGGDIMVHGDCKSSRLLRHDRRRDGGDLHPRARVARRRPGIVPGAGLSVPHDQRRIWRSTRTTSGTASGRT